MKKFIVYLLVIVLTVSLGFAVFFLVRDDEVISISSASIYKDKGDPFKIEVEHINKNPQTEIDIYSSDDNIVSYDKDSDTFYANEGGVARINFRTSNVKFRNLWCDVIVGDGTVESPYYISSAEQLAAIGMGEEIKVDGVGTGVFKGKAPYEDYQSDLCYKLIDNVDASLANQGYWIPLRNFTGRFDGNGYTISNINIDRNGFISDNAEVENFDESIFPTDSVGFMSKIDSSAVVYNVKFANYKAFGTYDIFGTVAGINNGTIERVEVKDAFLSVNTNDLFGGIVGKNESTEIKTADNYTRNIAVVDRCSILMTVGQQQSVDASGEIITTVLGVNGTIGGLVGENIGGKVLYSYSNGSVYFGTEKIVFGGVVAKNTYKVFTDKNTEGEVFDSLYEGAHIKDTYSNITTYLMNSPKVDDRFGGVIAINTDYSNSLYKGDSSMAVVNSYIIGNYYNKTNLNATQENITKQFDGIAEFNVGGDSIDYVDIKTVAYGLTYEEMKDGLNFVSYKIDAIKFDENGNSLGVKPSETIWLFDTVWAINVEINDGMPYLLYQLAYIQDDFNIIGTPMILNGTTYSYKAEVSYPIEILDTDGVNDRKMYIHIGETLDLQVEPAGLILQWSSNNEGCVTVDASGKITAHTKGTATITAKSGDYRSDIRIVVNDIVYEVVCEIDEIIIEQGQTYDLSYVNVTTKPAGGIIRFTVDNDMIASVSGGLYLTGLKVNDGVKCNLIISCGSSKYYIPIRVIKSSSKLVMITADKYTVNAEFTGTAIHGKITVTSVMSDTVDVKDLVELTYISNNQDIVQVDNNGNYIIKGTGTAKVTINCNNNGYVGTRTITFNITVPDVSDPETPDLEIIDIEKDAYAVKVGHNITIKTNTVTREIIWSTSDAKIATVENGVVTGISSGVAQITAKIQNADGSWSYDNCYVSVESEASIVMTASKTRAYVGETITVHYTVVGGDYDISYVNGAYVSADESKDGVISLELLSAGVVEVWIRSGNTSKFVAIEIISPITYQKYIYTVDDLLNINNFLTGKEYILCADIDLNGMSWTPIGTKETPFSSSFEVLQGKNYTIKNFKVNVSNDSGLFGYAHGATFKGINIEKATIENSSASFSSGALVGTAYGCDISDCTVKNSIVKSPYATGGLVGFATDCRIVGSENISSANDISGVYVGGIVGYIQGNSIVSNAIVDSCNIYSIHSNKGGFVGGIAGRALCEINSVRVQGGTRITSGNASNYFAGGIVGIAEKLITRAYNNDSVVSGYYAGGIAGQMNIGRTMTIRFSDYKKSYRVEDLDYSKSVGFDISDAEWVGVKNTVTVKGNYVGGFFGEIISGTIRNSYTQAKLEGVSSSSCLGGFAAYIRATSGIKNEGGVGQIGIVDLCYSACTFSGSGDKNAITDSLVHNYKSNNASRATGFVMRYLYDETLAKGADYVKGSNLFGKDYQDAGRKTAEMKESIEYAEKAFSLYDWVFSGDNYPIHKNEF